MVSVAQAKSKSRDSGQHGIVGILLQLWTNRKAVKTFYTRQMELLETLPLGGKRQLMLVRCSHECFLVGGSFDCIEAIVKVQAEGICDPHQDGFGE